MPEGVMVAIMFEEGDRIVTDAEGGIMELDSPDIELVEGNSEACCSKSFGFKFEDLWGGR